VISLVLPFLLLSSQPDTTTVPVVLRFTGDIGYVATSGNTSVETLNLGDKFSVRIDDLTLSQSFVLVYGESEGETVTSNYRTTFRVDKGLKAAGLFAYTSIKYERNTFAGLASRVSGNAGLSAHLITSDNDHLVLESGVSLNRQRATPTKGRDRDFLGGRAATTYTHSFSKRASLSQEIEILPNLREADDVRINTETSLVAPLAGNVNIKISYLIRYDGLPSEGFESTDRLFTSGIQLSL
jgi:putative salt-induced outer membrane protein YdiY